MPWQSMCTDSKNEQAAKLLDKQCTLFLSEKMYHTCVDDLMATIQSGENNWNVKKERKTPYIYVVNCGSPVGYIVGADCIMRTNTKW